MPFLDDIGPRDERRHPGWEAFAALGDQLERLVAVNVAWSVQLLPGVLALAFPTWPGWIRGVLGFYTAVAIAPATGVLYGIAAHACRRQHVSLDLVRDELARMAVASLRGLAPLGGSLAALGWADYYVTRTGSLGMLGAPLTLAVLLWSVCATYWGPLLAANPDLSATAVARASVRLVSRSPGQSLACWAITVVAALVGAVSVAGLFLVVPVLVVLTQTAFHRQAGTRSHPALVNRRTVAS